MKDASELTPLEFLGYSEKISMTECLGFKPLASRTIKESEVSGLVQNMFENTEDAKRLQACQSCSTWNVSATF